MNIKNKNILITGANRGIGLALAQKAATEGLNIHLLCRSRDKAVEKELEKFGAGYVKTWILDLSSSENIKNFLEEFKKSKIKPHMLVNNSGQLTGGLLENQPTEKIYQMFQVNLVGLVHLTQGLLPLMLKLDQAKIINNASVSGVMYLPCASTYAASKAGVIAFTESLRNELVGTPVSTLAMITPGVKTRMFDEIPDLYSDHVSLDFMDSIPASQWADRVFDCIKKDQKECWPKGKTYWGTKMGQHSPGLLSRIVKPYFKRSQ